MADIIQAAKWMQEGKSVRRPHYGTKVPSGESYPHALQLATTEFEEDGLVVVCTCHLSRKHFSAASLLADDWEIAE